jgi:hypothetical protein
MALSAPFQMPNLKPKKKPHVPICVEAALDPVISLDLGFRVSWLPSLYHMIIWT